MYGITEGDFREDIPRLYGNWGVDSEIGTLRAVLMRRGGKEIEGITDPKAMAMKEVWDVEKVRHEQDVLAEIYRSHGVAVHYIEEMGEAYPNGIYVRDLVLMTPDGAIVARPAASCRVGEEVYAARQLSKLGVPIIKTIHGTGIFDGACLLWMDAQTCLLGYGLRCNASGISQVEAELSTMGVKHVIKVEIPRGMAHLDSFMAFADYKTALVLRMAAPNTVYTELERRGIQIIDIPDLEEFAGFCQNMVALKPGTVVMPTGCPKTVKALEKAGVEVIQTEVGEVMKGNGAIHCMTAFLKRDSVPLYLPE
ncbi:MAG: amidinotransferase [Lachnospiraceae bacterium]|nr:amidinotransferase [Lachnospiraceae bacterium]